MSCVCVKFAQPFVWTQDFWIILNVKNDSCQGEIIKINLRDEIWTQNKMKWDKKINADRTIHVNEKYPEITCNICKTEKLQQGLQTR